MAQRTTRLDFSKVDSWFAVGQWVLDRAAAFIASGVGAALMGYAASISAPISRLGPIGWASIAFVAFVALYALFVLGRYRLSIARRNRADAMFAERLQETAHINPVAAYFQNQRVRLSDLYSPFNGPLVGKHFVECELIGPAVIYLGQQVVFRGNTFDGVEIVRVNEKACLTLSNKISLHGGAIERCKIYNVIFLVADTYAPIFENMFPGQTLQWMNDPINPPSANSLPPSLPSTGQGTRP